MEKNRITNYQFIIKLIKEIEELNTAISAMEEQNVFLDTELTRANKLMKEGITLAEENAELKVKIDVLERELIAHGIKLVFEKKPEFHLSPNL